MHLDNPRLDIIHDTAINMDGFRLIGYKKSHDFFTINNSIRDDWIRSLRKVCVSLNIPREYTFGKMIGRGSFAKVHLAKRNTDNLSFAIKTIFKSKILENPRNTEAMHKEIMTLRRIDHPNVIKLYEVYENEIYIHLVMEYLEGGELFKRLQSKGTYSEKDASLAINHILQALAYCHGKNIIHRDLKPENLIMA